MPSTPRMQEIERNPGDAIDSVLRDVGKTADVL